ncbi:MAG TPA: hypothetical protein VK589_08355 [Chryseolinea sp.]|nr:hypothetical protein [Chryseolinea sp.]
MIREIKKYLAAIVFVTSVFGVFCANGQNPLSQTTQVEVGIGYATPLLQSGQELTRSEDLRDQGLSYFENSQGDRKNVGSYSGLKGYSFNIGFYKPLKKTNGLMVGAMVRNTQTGSTPDDGYQEAYFFNFITAGPALKYYPFANTNLFAKADFGLAAVLTKNRFINEEGDQNFFHQFGIGSGGSLGAGYSFLPFKDNSKSLDVQLIYQQLSTRVEVNGIGDDQWKFGTLNFTVAVSF